MPKINFINKHGESIERDLPKDEILFIALEESGTELRHGCLSGSCGTCKINVTANPDGLQEPGAIETDTLKAIYANLKDRMPEEEIKKLHLRLACRAKINGDLSFEAFQTPKKESDN